MAEEYAKVLNHQKKSFTIIGRGKKTALAFEKKIGKKVQTGGLKINLTRNMPPDIAIVAVGVENLKTTTERLIKSGTKRILLEKPGSINLSEIRSLNILAKKKKAEVLIAYNRRFYCSVKKLRELTKKDGGIESINFEFTEWTHKVLRSIKNSNTLKKWLIANSSHVIDLAFHLSGKPKNWKYWHSGSLNWHPDSAKFCGSGLTTKEIMFSYHANWNAPGRWGLEINTSRHRFILKPLEQLQAIALGSNQVKNIHLEDRLDKKFKPGLYLQLESFFKKDNSLFCSLSEQVENIKIYSKIAGYI